MRLNTQRATPTSRTVVAAVLAATVATAPALAKAWDQVGDTAFGARPGNVIGTGISLPTSDQASNITEGNTHSRIAPRLPSPLTGSDSPHDLLRAALRALDGGRTGEAQEALERAETRLLSRSVGPPGLGSRSTDPLVLRIAQARQLLAEGDRERAAHLLEVGLPPSVADAAG